MTGPGIRIPAISLLTSSPGLLSPRPKPLSPRYDRDLIEGAQAHPVPAKETRFGQERLTWTHMAYLRKGGK